MPDSADVVLTDILDGVPAGKALDMLESAPILGRMRMLRGFRPLPAIIARRRTVTSSLLRRDFRASLG